ncbi:MAG: integrase family protein [Desulfocapsa sp.]|nr:integrase family protein [Desulfocapsa sp.]
MRADITPKNLQKLQPQSKPYFLRSIRLRGFAVKVNPSGSIRYIAETKFKGTNHRKTIGQYPTMSLDEAKNSYLAFLQSIRSGNHQHKQKPSITLEELFNNYTSSLDLKESTLKDYSMVIPHYLSDWMNKKVSSITKQMIEKRFCLIRDKGWKRGKPTYSQATKVMRILSALLSFAQADDLIEANPVDVLKQKRVKRSIIKRTSYLTREQARKVSQSLSTHPVELAMSLMLYTGLRKNEALSLQWKDVSEELITISDTKNHRPHLIPVTEQIQIIINSIPTTSSPYLFPSPVNKQRHIKDVRATLKKLEKATGISFRCHDLRRSFATRASEVGIDYLMIKRLLNHKSNDITSQYIQWDSKQNLEKMREALERVTY